MYDDSIRSSVPRGRAALRSVPGDESPGYYRASLRDFGNLVVNGFGGQSNRPEECDKDNRSPWFGKPRLQLSVFLDSSFYKRSYFDGKRLIRSSKFIQYACHFGVAVYIFKDRGAICQRTPFARLNRSVGETAIKQPSQCFLVAGLVVAKLEAVHGVVGRVPDNEIEIIVRKAATRVIVGYLRDAV